MSGVALEANGLVRAYDGRRVVDVENMVVEPGRGGGRAWSERCWKEYAVPDARTVGEP